MQYVAGSLARQLAPNNDDAKKTIRHDDERLRNETQEQLAQLRSLNCNFAQGYLFSKPIEQELVIKLLAVSPQW